MEQRGTGSSCESAALTLRCVTCTVDSMQNTHVMGHQCLRHVAHAQSPEKHHHCVWEESAGQLRRGPDWKATEQRLETEKGKGRAHGYQFVPGFLAAVR